MADLLAESGETRLSDVRKELRKESSGESDDLLSRMNALDYLDSVVGQVSSDIPQRLGEYRITGLLGRGGMGTVFEAFQESLEREVALKILAPTMTADPGMRRRFRTEARANAALHHQHIVPVYGFGEASGFLYFTMERVDGVSLDKHVSAARHRGAVAMAPLDAARRFAGVADALGHAHKRGVYHRDIKPGNILVHPDGELALADFGLSKMIGDASVSVSRAGFLGTLHYASPEQAKGESAGPSSDLYSLGVTMFEVMTGHLPLAGKTTEAILQSLLHGTPRRLREFLPKVGKDLDAVMRKLLHKDPSERYADGEALARDLIRVADGDPVRIRRQSIFVLAWRQVRKHPALSSAVLVAAVLFLVSLGLWRTNDQQRTTTRYQNLIAEAMSVAEGEVGSAAGPDRLLESLTGLAVRESPAASRVLGLLEDAARQRPDDPQPDSLRMSYLSDPLPRATMDLLRGRGNDALILLDQAISNLEARSGFAGREEVTWLELYRLYVARAVAKLSVTVSQPDDASKDLIRASLVRPGAYFPRMLGAFLDWKAEEGAAALLSQVDTLIAEAPSGAQDAVGAMLLAFSGLSRPIGAGIMPFELSYGQRRQFYARATALLGDQWTSLEDHERQQQAGPIEASLVANAAGALSNLSDRPAANAYLQKGQAELDALAPSSVLHSWRLVFALLNSSKSVPELPSGVAMPLSMQMRAWNSLLDLDPPPSLLRRLGSSLEELLARAGNDPIALEIKAKLELRISEPAIALQAAEEWVQAEADNPSAYLCRFRCHLRLWNLPGAQEDAVLAFQYAVDPDRMRRRVSSLMSVALDTQAGQKKRADWETFHREFSEDLD